MNIYISKVESTHLFTITPENDENFYVTKPDGKKYICSIPEFPQNIKDFDNFVTNNEIISKLTEEEKKNKASDFIIKGIKSSILNDSGGYDIFEIMLVNSSKLAKRNFIFYMQEEFFESQEGITFPDLDSFGVLMLKDIDNNKEIAASDPTPDILKDFLGFDFSGED